MMQILVFTPTKESEGYIGYYADKSKEDGNHFTLVHQLRCMNCNQAECEWNCSGTRAIVKVSSDVDRVIVLHIVDTRLVFLTMVVLNYIIYLMMINFDQTFF